MEVVKSNSMIQSLQIGIGILEVIELARKTTRAAPWM